MPTFPMDLQNGFASINRKDSSTPQRSRTSRVVDLVLCSDKYFSTSSASDTTETFMVVVENGLQIEDILGGIALESFTPTLRIKLVLQFSHDGNSWNNGSAIIVDQYGQAPVAYKLGLHSTRTDYGRFVRFQVVYKSSDGSAAYGRVSCHAAVKYYGQ